jgi:glutaredoxin
VLRENKVDFVLFEVDWMVNGEDILDTLNEFTGTRQVPNLFIGGEPVGDYLKILKQRGDGKLKEKLDKF